MLVCLFFLLLAFTLDARYPGLESRERAGDQGLSLGTISALFVDNLPFDIRKIWVHNLFSKFGKIVESYFPSKRKQNFGEQIWVREVQQ